MDKIRFLLIISAVFFIQLPAAANEFALQSKASQKHSFLQPSFNIYNNLRQKDFNDAAKSEPDLFIGRIGDTDGGEYNNAAAEKALKTYMAFRNTGIILTVIGANMMVAGAAMLGSFYFLFSPIVGLCMLGVLIPGVALFCPGVGVLGYAVSLRRRLS